MIYGNGYLAERRKKMGKLGQKEASSGLTPPGSQLTTPPDYSKGDYSTFILPAILEMQKTLGQLTQAITTLTHESEKNTDKIDAIGKLTQAVATLSETSKISCEKLDKISHKVFAAEVVIGIVGGILALVGYGLFNLLGKIWNVIYPMIQIKPHP
jgi:hypothetical protein